MSTNVLLGTVLLLASVIGCSSSPSVDSTSKEVDELVSKINENIDGLHSEYSDAVWQLLEYELDALPALFPLMLNEHRGTRLRAESAIKLLTQQHFGWRRYIGWPDEESHENWIEFWQETGSLDYSSNVNERSAAVGLMEIWLEQTRD